MNISMEQKKAEAVSRMKMFGIFPETIRQFEKDGKVSISEPPMGAFYWAEDGTLTVFASSRNSTMHWSMWWSGPIPPSVRWMPTCSSVTTRKSGRWTARRSSNPVKAYSLTYTTTMPRIVRNWVMLESLAPRLPVCSGYGKEEQEMTVYAVSIRFNGTEKLSQEAYSSLEEAHRFIKSRVPEPYRLGMMKFRDAEGREYLIHDLRVVEQKEKHEFWGSQTKVLRQREGRGQNLPSGG